MNWLSLKRAVQLGGKPRGWWLLYVTGVLSALIVPMMVLVLGAITDLFATRGNIEIPAAESKDVAVWAWFILIASARASIASLAVFLVILLLNMGEATLFSPGGAGLLALVLIGWCISGSRSHHPERMH